VRLDPKETHRELVEECAADEEDDTPPEAPATTATIASEPRHHKERGYGVEAEGQKQTERIKSRSRGVEWTRRNRSKANGDKECGNRRERLPGLTSRATAALPGCGSA
jgi:hypothetical protein